MPTGNLKLKYLAGLTILVFGYLAWAQFSLWLTPVAQPYVPPIWPPTGIGLAVVIIFGYRYWPGIFVGECALTASMGIPIQVALGIGIGNTLEAMLGAYLLQRVRGFDRTLTRLSDVWAFVTLAALVAPTIGATIGSVSLGWGQVADLPPMTEIWWTWWLSDAMGALLAAPVLLTWISIRLQGWTWHQIMEVSALVTLLILLGVLVLGGWVVPPVSYPLEYLFFPFVVWSALRLGQRGSTLTILVATAIAIWDWSHGLGLVAVKANPESLLELQGFLGVLSVTGMALAAAMNERRAAEAALQARAAELQELSVVLKSEIGQRKQAEHLARGQRDALAKALLFLTAESDLDKFLGHVLKVMVDELRGIGGALWFPDRDAGSVRLHLEYVDGHMVSAAHSKYPAPYDPMFFEHPSMLLGPEASNETRFFSEGDPDVLNDVWRYLRSIGARGLLRLPMLLGEATIGWVTVRSGERQMPNLDSKIGFIEALSRQATLAIQMARLGEEARESAVLTERNRMARDIHDTLAQGFTGIIMQLQAADDALAREGTDAVQSHIARASELARQSLSEARRSVRALRPRALEDVPLATAIHSMIRKLTDGTDIRPEVTVLGKPWPLVTEWEEELLRIVQEALTNTLKHANASLFEVKLVFEGSGLQLEIHDDGIGFDPTRQYEGFGLMGMSERANRIGGKLTVLSLPGKGAEIRVALPPVQTGTEAA